MLRRGCCVADCARRNRFPVRVPEDGRPDPGGERGGRDQEPPSRRRDESPGPNGLDHPFSSA